MYSVGDSYEAAIECFGRIYRSRTNKATRNSNTVTTNDASNAGRTTSRYVASTSHNWPMITRIFEPSARNIATTVAPAVLPGAISRTNAYTTPAAMLITPPNPADSAPCIPAHSPAIAAMTNVAAACQMNTARNGRVEGVATNQDGRNHCTNWPSPNRRAKSAILTAFARLPQRNVAVQRKSSRTVRPRVARFPECDGR